MGDINLNSGIGTFVTKEGEVFHFIIPDSLKIEGNSLILYEHNFVYGLDDQYVLIGDDYLFGGQGNDMLESDTGDDFLYGNGESLKYAPKRKRVFSKRGSLHMVPAVKPKPASPKAGRRRGASGSAGKMERGRLADSASRSRKNKN